MYVVPKRKQEFSRAAMQVRFFFPSLLFRSPRLRMPQPIHTSKIIMTTISFYLGLHAGLGGGHFGRDKTLDKICSRFYWQFMVQEIREYVKCCKQCQQMNAAFVKTNAKLHPIPVQPKVWHQVCIMCFVSNKLCVLFTTSYMPLVISDY